MVVFQINVVRDTAQRSLNIVWTSERRVIVETKRFVGFDLKLEWRDIAFYIGRIAIANKSPVITVTLDRFLGKDKV